MQVHYLFQIRVTGILVRGESVLLVKQRVNEMRAWSLPGGRVEAGERLDEAIVREFFEETGFRVKVQKLLYVCDKNDCAPPVAHITFLLEKTGGVLTLPTNEFDENRIEDVQFVPFSRLTAIGFKKRFVDLLAGGFVDAGAYRGLKENIGL